MISNFNEIVQHRISYILKYREEQLPQASAVLYYHFEVLWEGKQTQQVTAVLDSVNIEV